MKTSGSVADARNAGANARYGLRLDLRGPLTVDGLRSANARQIERKVGDVDPVALPDQARREQQPDGRAVPIDAVEVTELGDDLAGLVDDHDLVGLVGRDPDVVVLVEDQAVGT